MSKPIFLLVSFFFLLVGIALAEHVNITEAIMEAKSMLTSQLDESIARLEKLANEHHSDEVMHTLGKIYQTNDYKILDPFLSQYWFLKAAYSGNAESQYQVAFLFGNNLIQQSILDKVHKELEKPLLDLDKVDINALSLIHYMTGAYDGNLKSKIAMGYKYLRGYGVPKDCQKSAEFYQNTAKETTMMYELGSPPFVEKVKLEDEESQTQKQTMQEIMDYYKYSAEKGMSSAQLIMGYAYMYGIRGVEQNTEIALEYLKLAAQGGESEAFGPLGNIYAKGIGVIQNNETALSYFKQGAELGDSYSHNGLGYMYLRGAGVTKDLNKAFHYFNLSSSKGNPEGQYNYGMMFFRGDGIAQNYKNAFNLFTAAAAQHNLQSYYQLGVMSMKGLSTTKDCQIAVKFFKSVTEKGAASSLLDDGYHSFLEGKHRDSLLHYLQAADLGFETAQLNAAYLLEKELGDEFLNEIRNKTTNIELDLKYHKMLADQGNVMAMVKVGDHYYYGLGTNVSIEKSLANYRKAGDLRNAQALFNLAYMHEHGEGLTKDFYLAKRYYDMARESGKDAYMPVMLSMTWLYAKWGYQMIWNPDLRAGIVIPNIKELFSQYEDLILYIMIALFGFLLLVRFLARPRQANQVQQQ